MTHGTVNDFDPSKAMLHVNSIALLTVSLNLATFVQLFTNLVLRFVGAQNHSKTP